MNSYDEFVRQYMIILEQSFNLKTPSGKMEYFQQQVKESPTKKFVEKLNKMTRASGNRNKLGPLRDAISGFFEQDDEYVTPEMKEQFSCEQVQVKANSLHATQNQIGMTSSLKSVLLRYDLFDQITSNKEGNAITVKGSPIIICNLNGISYIIDGHHRWSKVMMFNPSGTVKCHKLSFPKKFISNPDDILKIVQAGIKYDGNFDRNLPVDSVEGQENLLDEKSVGKETLKNFCEKIFKSSGATHDLIEKISENTVSSTRDDNRSDNDSGQGNAHDDKWHLDNLVKKLFKNLSGLRKNCQFSNTKRAVSREYMPQLDKNQQYRLTKSQQKTEQ